MKTKITNIIKILKEIRQEENLQISDEVIFKEAISTYRVEQASMQKKEPRLTGETHPPVNSNQFDKEPISKPQANYLEKNREDLIARGFNLKDIQYKSDAFKIIKEHKKLLENGN